ENDFIYVFVNWICKINRLLSFWSNRQISCGDIASAIRYTWDQFITADRNEDKVNLKVARLEFLVEVCLQNFHCVINDSAWLPFIYEIKCFAGNSQNPHEPALLHGIKITRPCLVKGVNFRDLL